MHLFQNSVLQQYLASLNQEPISKAFEVYKKDFLPKIENIKSSKEEQYQYGFLDDLFVKVLGYTLNPTPNYNLTTEQKNLTDSKKADGAIIKDGKVIAVIELKSTKTKVMDKIVNQAFNYKNNHPTCKYIITSNFEKLRFYIEHSDKFEEFNLFGLNEERFTLLYTLLNQESIFADVALHLKEDSKLQEEKISNELYKKYSQLRVSLFENLVKNNPQIERLELLENTQKLLDRMIFIFFAEDRGILPTNTIQAIVDRYKDDIESRELYHFYKIYFRAINEGNSRLKISEYNGGLFATDKALDERIIDDEVMRSAPLALSAYDFNSDVDVNILGHIFENSLNDIEEMKAKIDDESFDVKKSKRKKDGVFYTPEYITKYIVDNTLGKLCEAKKEELGLTDIEIKVPKNLRKLNKGETKQRNALDAYREYLLQLKILDPACGSGAFLNQALNFLLAEHEFIDESIKTLEGGGLGLYDVRKGILENNLYGVDINAEAVEIAKLSLWLRTVEKGRKLNSLAEKIKVANSLMNMPFEEESFDIVIGNPPYVRQERIKEQKVALKEKYQTFVGTADLYVYFYELGIKMLKSNAMLGYICSNKYYTVKYGEPLRAFLLDNTTLEIFTDFGDKKIFDDATVTSDINIFKKNKPSAESNFKIVNSDLTNSFDMLQSDLSKSGFAFVSPQKLQLKKRIEEMGTALKEWNINIFRGILTGFNEAFIIDVETKNKLIEEDIKSSELLKPMLNGRDVKKYEMNFANQWLLYIPWDLKIDDYPIVLKHLQIYYSKLSTRPEVKSKRYKWYSLSRYGSDYIEEFEKEKIIWMELSDAQTFMLDSNNYYINKTLYFMTGDSLRYLLAVLNSKVIFYYYNLTSASSGVGTIMWQKINVEKLPIPKISETKEQPFIEKSNIMLQINKTFQSKQEKFLKRISTNFEIEKLSKKLEAFYKYDFKTFLKELKKKKVTLTLIQQDEWEEYFEAYQKELLDLQAQIDATDREIDLMVYELYGLSDDEIALVEGKDE
jgi:type I restriction-modification system DNA methylase subunit